MKLIVNVGFDHSLQKEIPREIEITEEQALEFIKMTLGKVHYNSRVDICKHWFAAFKEDALEV